MARTPSKLRLQLLSLTCLVFTSSGHSPGGTGRTLLGINVEVLEDGPLRPKDAAGNPLIPLIPSLPQPWWFDGVIVAPPMFSVERGIFTDRVAVKIYCSTYASTIFYAVGEGENHELLPDPTPLTGQVYTSGEDVVLVRSGFIKAMAYHPYALDSSVVATGSLIIQSPAPTITVDGLSVNVTIGMALGPFNESTIVTITAASSTGDLPYIRYTLDTNAPTMADGVPAQDPQGKG